MSAELHEAAPTAEVRRQAERWVVLLASGRVTVGEAEEFRRWHADDPSHEWAFAEAKLHWDVLGAATHGLAAEPDAAVTAPRRTLSRRRLIVGAGVAAAAAGAAAIIRPPLDIWPPLIDLSADYRTGIGDRRVIALAQDASVELSTRSRLALREDRPDALVVALLSGEVAVTAGARPVIVTAGAGETRALRGRFDLRHDTQSTEVTCVDGPVEVACRGGSVTLGAGQAVRYGDSGISSVENVDRDVVTAWQRGLLVFHGQPLQRVIDEVNRYRPGRIILLNRDLAGRRVALASFHIDRLDEVVPELEALFNLRARHLLGGVVLLS